MHFHHMVQVTKYHLEIIRMTNPNLDNRFPTEKVLYITKAK